MILTQLIVFVSVCMDVLSDRLGQVLRLNHDDQQRRIRAGEVEDPNAIAAALQRLDSLTIPPSIGSPGSLSGSSTKMDSPDSETRRANVYV
jgi:hypothetical protein